MSTAATDSIEFRTPPDRPRDPRMEGHTLRDQVLVYLYDAPDTTRPDLMRDWHDRRNRESAGSTLSGLGRAGDLVERDNTVAPILYRLTDAGRVHVEELLGSAATPSAPETSAPVVVAKPPPLPASPMRSPDRMRLLADILEYVQAHPGCTTRQASDAGVGGHRVRDDMADLATKTSWRAPLLDRQRTEGSSGFRFTITDHGVAEIASIRSQFPAVVAGASTTADSFRIGESATVVGAAEASEISQTWARNNIRALNFVQAHGHMFPHDPNPRGGGLAPPADYTREKHMAWLAWLDRWNVRIRHANNDAVMRLEHWCAAADYAANGGTHVRVPEFPSEFMGPTAPESEAALAPSSETPIEGLGSAAPVPSEGGPAGSGLGADGGQAGGSPTMCETDTAQSVSCAGGAGTPTSQAGRSGTPPPSEDFAPATEAARALAEFGPHLARVGEVPADLKSGGSALKRPRLADDPNCPTGWRPCGTCDRYVPPDSECGDCYESNLDETGSAGAMPDPSAKRLCALIESLAAEDFYQGGYVKCGCGRPTLPLHGCPTCGGNFSLPDHAVRTLSEMLHARNPGFHSIMWAIRSREKAIDALNKSSGVRLMASCPWLDRVENLDRYVAALKREHAAALYEQASAISKEASAMLAEAEELRKAEVTRG